MANLTPEVPVTNAGFKYINGMSLVLSPASATTLLIYPGICRDSTNINDILISTTGEEGTNLPISVSLASSGAGGLDVGTVATNTVYAVYAIGSSTNQIGTGQPYSAYPGSALLSLSMTTPVLPFGYDMFRRIGSIATYTDTTTKIRPFTQVGTGATRKMLWVTPVAATVTAGASTTNAAVGINATPNIPALATTVYLLTSLTPGAAGHTVSVLPTGGAAAAVYAQMSGPVAAVVSTGVLECPCSATPQIDYRVSVNTAAVAFSVLGYDDQL